MRSRFVSDGIEYIKKYGSLRRVNANLVTVLMPPMICSTEWYWLTNASRFSTKRTISCPIEQVSNSTGLTDLENAQTVVLEPQAVTTKPPMEGFDWVALYLSFGYQKTLDPLTKGVILLFITQTRLPAD